MNRLDFVVVGVGGQGTVLASDILAEVGMLVGYDVKKSDVLGLAVRGGSVLSHVRWADRVASPVVPRGRAHYVLAFELLEALRMVEYLAPDGTVLVNALAIPPVSVSSEDAEYPSYDEVREVLAAAAARVFFVDATATAQHAGSAQAANVVILGAFSSLIDVPVEVWERVVLSQVPAKYRQLNAEAFRAGRVLLKGASK